MAGSALRILEIYPKGDFSTVAAVQLRDLARGLAARGHHVTVATPPSEMWAGRCREAGLAHAAIAIREALACERPVVATRLEGPELAVDGETGWLVPPREPTAMAAAILRLLRHSTAAQAMARAGRKRVETTFSPRARLDTTETLYQCLAAGGCA